MSHSNKLKLAILLLILGMAIFMRFAGLRIIPPGLYPDEAMNGNNALEVLKSGLPWYSGFKVFYPENNGREGLFINIQALMLKVLGNEPWALRVVSAIFGTLTVLALYFLAKELFAQKQEEKSIEPGEKQNNASDFLNHTSNLLPLLTTFFLATSYWHITFSRIGFRAISAPFFLTLAVWGLVRGLRTGSIPALIVGGLSFGLGFNTYISYRLTPLIIAIPIIIALKEWWKNKGNTERKCAPCAILLFLFFAFIAVLPLGLYYIKHPADFMGRAGQVSIFNTTSPIQAFFLSTAKTLGMFNIVGDCNWRHNYACWPELWPPVGLLFLLGIGISLRTFWKKNFIAKRSALLLLVWLVVTLLPAMLSGEGVPHALRTLLAVIPAAAFAAIGLKGVMNYTQDWLKLALANPKYNIYQGQLLRIGRELFILLIVFLVAIPVFTLKAYSQWGINPNTFDAFAGRYVLIGQYLNKLPQNLPKFVIVNELGVMVRGIPMPAQTIMFITDTFLPEDREKKNIHYLLPNELPQLGGINKGIIIPLETNSQMEAQLHDIFPGKTLRKDFLGALRI